MKNNNMQALQANSYLSGSNASYIEELYETYLRDKNAVSESWRNYFAGIAAKGEVSHAEIREHFAQLAKQGHQAFSLSGNTAAQVSGKQAQVTQLINAYRHYGHHRAKTDPLSLAEPAACPELDLTYYGLDQSDFATRFDVSGLAGLGQTSLQEIIDILQRTYCGSIGLEYVHICEEQQYNWLQKRFEIEATKPKFDQQTKLRILKGLTAAEGLEKYLASKYVGQKRFSLEGGDSLIPMFDELVQRSASQQVTNLVIGMAHRGRLNMLINVLGKPSSELFEEFAGKNQKNGYSGDVKYHMGYSSDRETPAGSVHLALSFNPSHLEIIAPVVEGSVYARQQRANDVKKNQVIPIIIHGDAAFAGQGVVMETLNFSQTRGFSTGGTVHIVINNQVGFTTSNPHDARSTPYCTDVAKMIESPVFHVNADDPEAVLFVTQLALDFRITFNKDVVIDLVCYRRHGHNEADEPAATQPVMYREIRQHPTARTLYAERLISEKIISTEEADALVADYRDTLDAGKSTVPGVMVGNHTPFAADWSPYLNQKWTAATKSSFEASKLKTLAQQLEKIPEGMVLQPQVAKLIEDRRKMTAGELPLNWGYAETLAYATLLSQGYNIRLTGQDSGRGTFAHRHATLYDFNTGQRHIPLQKISADPKAFTLIDSLLSEEAVLGFEYGFSATDPESLVLWEAQFGDFANGAQVVIDQFISSGEQKWGRLASLVMLLPHGYEGQGPEHSSARLERYLQLCAQHNMQVCVPSTPAQIYHLLRRQLLRPFRTPLIVMTPKSLLRHKLAVSSLADLAKGQFQLVIPESQALKADSVRRIVLCSGKVYYDLFEQRHDRQDVIIIRIEQLYPFPDEALIKELKRYKKATDVIWCQEEPMNQGAWYQIRHRLEACAGKGLTVQYAGRDESASPAVGYASLHQEQQAALVKQALG